MLGESGVQGWGEDQLYRKLPGKHNKQGYGCYVDLLEPFHSEEFLEIVNSLSCYRERHPVFIKCRFSLYL